MNEQDIRKIVQDEMHKNFISGTPKVPPHFHDGVSNSRILAKNIVPNNALSVWIAVTEGTAQQNTAIIGSTVSLGITNPSSVSFHGIAQNPVSGTATKKTMIQGNAQIGNVGLQINAVGTNSTIKNIVQSNCSTVFDHTTGSWVPTVDADNINLASIYDTDGTLLGYLQVTSFTNTSVTISGPIPSGWLLQGSLIIS